MASSKGDNSSYVRSAYRRSGSERPSYGRPPKNRGWIWSVIIVILLIIILVGGAVWLYFLNRKVGAEEAEIAPQSSQSSQASQTSAPPQLAEANTGGGAQ